MYQQVVTLRPVAGVCAQGSFPDGMVLDYEGQDPATLSVPSRRSSAAADPGLLSLPGAPAASKDAELCRLDEEVPCTFPPPKACHSEHCALAHAPQKPSGSSAACQRLCCCCM